jgi:hypothetical protein
VERPTQPVETRQGETTIQTFTPVEVGWVMVDKAPDLDSGEDRLVRVYPMSGWVLVDDGADWREYSPVDNRGNYDLDAPVEVYFSRQLFREAQGGELIISRVQLRKAVSE